VGTKAEVGAALQVWLNQFNQVELCADYPLDFELFGSLVSDPATAALPTWIHTMNIREQIAQREIERYWNRYGWQMHHALHGAKSNKFVFKCAHAGL
jgi:hypothetical protein